METVLSPYDNIKTNEDEEEKICKILDAVTFFNSHFPNSWNIMNRQELLEAYVDRLLDNMSTKDLMRIVGDQIEENLSGYSDEELIAEVSEYYPELIEGWFAIRK